MSNHHQSGRSLVEAEHHIKEAVEILREETSRLRQEQESIDAMSKKLDQVHFSSTVNLNVGGQHFTTSLQTLTKDPNSMLAAMFSGKFEMKPSKDGSFFIDRDGTHFRFILNFLRTGKLTLPKGATFTEELEEEAEFYQIQGLIDALRHADNSTSFAESVILTNEEHRRVLKGWLPEGLAGEWHLLFRASRDGFRASTFHSKCDNKGPTVTIVKSGGNIFGGFTKRAWESGSGYLQCSQAFLFSLVNPSGLGPTKMSLVTGKEAYAIFCGDTTVGPSFGGGCDLYISDNETFSNLGHTYQRPSGKQKTFFTDTRNFTFTDYEVFGLQQ
ncbi:hypothetical protein ABFA07_008366 [Porites harrisoni]